MEVLLFVQLKTGTEPEKFTAVVGEPEHRDLVGHRRYRRPWIYRNGKRNGRTRTSVCRGRYRNDGW